MRSQTLLIRNPKLAAQWHPQKNGSLKPSDVTAGSERKAWWICNEEKDHEWEATIASRNRGAGCPFCSGRRASKSNNLALLNPELASQWHPTKNQNITPFDVKTGSDKKVWWICKNNSEHFWKARIQERSRGSGCPICSGKQIIESNSLSFLNPELAQQWHPTKNKNLTPSEVTIGSGKEVWWKCPTDGDHVWKAPVARRTKGIGCPYCAGIYASKSNNLAFINSELAAEWHPTKNGQLLPSDVTANSSKKVWWKCPIGDDHEWDAVVASRQKGSGCPICSNQRVANSNCLASARPEFAKEWHPIKNNELTPFDVLPSSGRKIWWVCSKNPTHEWESKLNNRFNGKGCPFCANQLITKDNSLGATNPLLAAQWHPSKNGDLTPFDVAPAGKNKVWWQCPRGADHQWQATINHRATGTGCPICNPVWSIPELRIFAELKSFFPSIQHRAIIKKCEVDIYIPELKTGIEYDGEYWHRDKFKKDSEKNEKLSSSILLIRIREKDLPMIGTHDISIEKRDLTLSTIKNILSIIANTSCLSEEVSEKIRDYQNRKDWVASSLFNKLYAERSIVSFEKSLSFLHPKIANEWHSSKNEHLLPEHFTPGSGKNVWWIGKCGHEWQDTINHRTSGRDCPECRYKKASRTRKKNRMKYQLDLFD